MAARDVSLPPLSSAGCTKTQQYTFSYTLIFQMTIFICLSNFFRMPEKCLIIFAFHIEKRGGRVYIAPIFHLKNVSKREPSHHIFIFSADRHCFAATRQKSDVIFKFNETKRSRRIRKISRCHLFCSPRYLTRDDVYFDRDIPVEIELVIATVWEKHKF